MALPLQPVADRATNQNFQEIAKGFPPRPMDIGAIGPVFNVKDRSFGARGDGSDDTGAFLKAKAAMKSAKAGVLYVPEGRYRVSEERVIALEHPGQSVAGAGKMASIIEPTSAVTGPVITWSTLPASDKPAGTMTNLGFNGENAGAGAKGVEMGDLVSASLRDLYFTGFKGAGSHGLRVHNLAYWTEECHFDNLVFNDNKTGLEFARTAGEGNSYGYNSINVRINAFGNQCGMRIADEGHLYNVFLRLTGNLHEEGCVGLESAENTTLEGLLNIGLECNGSTKPKPLVVKPKVIWRGSGAIDTHGGGGTCVNEGSVSFSGFMRAPGITDNQGFADLGDFQQSVGKVAFFGKTPVSQREPGAGEAELRKALREYGLIP